MKILILIACGLILFSVTFAHAMVGDTLSACIEKYGEPKDRNRAESTWTFEKGNIHIIAHMFEGIVDRIDYYKTNLLGKSVEFSEKEIKQIRLTNSYGQNWRRMLVLGNIDYWISDAAFLLALYDLDDNTLTILSKAYADRIEIANEESKYDKLGK